MSTPPDGVAAAATLPAAAAHPTPTAEDAPVPEYAAAEFAAPPRRYTLTHPIEALLARQITAPMTLERRASLRAFWLDGVWASLSDSFAVNYIPLFALAFGATSTQIGILSAVSSLLGAAAFFPGARLIDRMGRRKPIVLWSVGVLYRGMLLLLALTPLLTGSAAAAISLIVVFASLRAFGVNLADPAWTSMAADLVPPFMRGRYFSWRNFLMGVAALIATPLAGLLIKRTAGWTGRPFAGYQLAFVLSFALGLMATLTFRRIVEPPLPTAAQEAAPRLSPWQILRSSRALLAFVVSAFVWNFSLQVAVPYFNIYLVKHLGGTELTVGVVTAISALAGLVGQIIYGRITERRGSVWVFLTSGFMITIFPVAWAFITAPWQVGINNLLSGFFWAGFTLATFNLLLLLTPDAQRPQAAALYQTVVFVSAVLGPLVGGYLADNVSFRLIFIVSGAGRLAAMLIFAALGARVAFAHERAKLAPRAAAI